MKRSMLIIPILVFSLFYGLTAQKVNEGVYLSAQDFLKAKISFGNNQNKKYRLYTHKIFNPSEVKIISGDSVIKLNKDSIFGYRDKNNTCYRFYNKVAYKIINPTEKILIYSCSSWTGGPKNSRNVTNYFFSVNAASPVYALSKWNLKTVFGKDVFFNEMLDVYFHSDNELNVYDNINHIYSLNRIYEMSRQSTSKTNNN